MSDTCFAKHKMAHAYRTIHQYPILYKTWDIYFGHQALIFKMD